MGDDLAWGLFLTLLTLGVGYLLFGNIRWTLKNKHTFLLLGKFIINEIKNRLSKHKEENYQNDTHNDEPKPIGVGMIKDNNSFNNHVEQSGKNDETNEDKGN